MSYNRRLKSKHAGMLHEKYPAPGGNEEALSKEDLAFNYDPGYPGPRETRLYDLYRTPTFTFDPGTIRDQVDWAAGGIPGDMKVVGSTGVTDSKNVDAHEFKGQMVTVRRMPDTNYGPVSGTDHNSLLSLLYSMQESSHYFPNEVSQADIIRSV
jgi:hypothetical protein